MKLKGRVAIITGGGTGIGKGVARCFAREGARLMLAQRRLEVAEKTAAELSGRALSCDVSSRSQVERLFEQTLCHYGQIDILVNNAAVTGLPALTPFLECSEEAWDNILDVNLKGTFLCSQLAARHMASRGKGVIINISSVGAYAAQSWAAAYCASKGGMEGLTKAMALELSLPRNPGGGNRAGRHRSREEPGARPGVGGPGGGPHLCSENPAGPPRVAGGDRGRRRFSGLRRRQLRTRDHADRGRRFSQLLTGFRGSILPIYMRQ